MNREGDKRDQRKKKCSTQEKKKMKLRISEISSPLSTKIIHFEDGEIP